MSAAFTFLIILVLASPLIALFEAPLVDGLVMAVVSATLVIIAVAMPPREAKHQVQSIRVMLLFLMIPALWMALQAVPLPLRGLANPVWQSAGAALDTPLTGSVTVDTGRTVLALARYLTMVGLIIASSAICINRSRAAKILTSLTIATVAIALLIIAGALMGSPSDALGAPLEGASALGVIVSTAAIFGGIERYATGDRLAASFLQMAWAQSPYFIANVICWIALVKFAPEPVTIAAAYGFALVIAIMLSRAVRAGRWAIMAFVGLAFGAIIVLAATRFAGPGDLTLGYSSAPAADIAAAERIGADTPWQGAGAGTFTALLPIYQEIDKGAHSASMTAPTTAAELAVELGVPAFGLIMILILIAAGLFLRGALTRGRDAYYPALAASSAIFLLLEGFIDISAIQTSVTILTAVIAGLGLAQITSRTVTNTSP